MVTGHLVINLDFNKTKYPRSKSTTVITVEVGSIPTITTMKYEDWKDLLLVIYVAIVITIIIIIV